MPFSTIPEAIEDFRAGRMIVVVDDEDRENEGDLTIAAEKVTPEAINFMARYGRGLDLPADDRRAARRAAHPADGARRQNTAALRHRLLRADRGAQGTTTGISAADRARTVLAAIDPKTPPEDLARPGHMFPLRAARGRRPRARAARPRPPSTWRGSPASTRPASSARS